MGEAKHFDNGKIGVDQIPPEMLFDLGRIYSYGERKYGRDNWKGGMDWDRVYGSALRHILSFWNGQDLDECDDSIDCAGADADFCPKHSRLPHLAHAIWNLTTLMYYQNHSLGKDTRDSLYDEEKAVEDEIQRIVSSWPAFPDINKATTNTINSSENPPNVIFPYNTVKGNASWGQ